MSSIRLATLTCLLAVGCHAPNPPRPPSRVEFTKRVPDPAFRAEGIAVADVNGDGARDVLVGNSAYLAPEWIRQELFPQAELDPATTFSDAFAVFAHDFNSDGRMDVLVVGFPLAGAVWREQPATEGAWLEHPLTGPSASESPLFLTLPGRSQPSLLYARGATLMALHFDGQGGAQETALATAPRDVPGHGLGFGDLNADGRPDVVTPIGAFLAESTGGYLFVEAELGPDCAQMQVFDVDGDGRADVLSSSAHLKGVFWHRQESPPADGSRLQFVRHTLDASFSQSHALVLADLNQDGRPELVTGKRRWAHGPNGDVDPSAPGVLYWFSFHPQEEPLSWTRHPVDAEEDSGVGTQFEVTDVDGDGRPDVVTANKEGVFLFLQSAPR